MSIRRLHTGLFLALSETYISISVKPIIQEMSQEMSANWYFLFVLQHTETPQMFVFCLQTLVQAGRSPASLWPSQSQLQRVQPQPRLPLLPLLPITHQWKTTQVTSAPVTSISSTSFSLQLLECQLLPPQPGAITATHPPTHRLFF